MNTVSARSPARVSDASSTPGSPLDRAPRLHAKRRRWLVRAAAIVALAFGLSNAVLAGFPATRLNLDTELNGRNGFFLLGGVNSGFGTGVSAAGDVNGDGLEDLIVGASRELPPPQGADSAGRVYVLFGLREGFPSVFDASTLDGSNGFRMDGETNNLAGKWVSGVGDVNGDGLDDLMIAPGHWFVGAGISPYLTQPAYVVFGRRDGFPAVLPLGSLDGSNGFKILAAGSQSNWRFTASGAGDINGDGHGDLVFGESYFEIEGVATGRAHVVFGREGNFPPVLSLADLDGSNGFAIAATGDNSQLGWAVAAAGDVNGDGLDDVILGAPGEVVPPPNEQLNGLAYVIYGSQNPFPAVLETSALNGEDGFSISADLWFGRSVGGIGDFNGDGLDDLVIGAPLARTDMAGGLEGAAYVLLGSDQGYPATQPNYVHLGLLNAEYAFKIQGVENGSAEVGHAVSGAGDLNGDGLADLVITGRRAGVGSGTGSAYILFGTRGELTEIYDATDNPAFFPPFDGMRGFVAQGCYNLGFCGEDVRGAGDLNGDGVDDLVIGGPGQGASSNERGRAFVLYGGLTGLGELPVATLSQASLDLGAVRLGETSATQTLTVTNTGYVVALELGALSLSGAHAAEFRLSNDGCSHRTLAQDASCSFDLSLTPAALGPRSATVGVPSNAPSGPDVVAVDGVGVQSGLGMSATAVDFGEVFLGRSSEAQTLTLENTGGAPLMLGTLSLMGPDAGDFALGANTCSNQTVAPGASCSLGITMTPAALGARAAQLIVPSDAPTSPDAVTLSGTGVVLTDEVFLNGFE
ncbi:choice-of-anchor D domain-containing protein [Aquimonas voraii]|uniref:FG-GAP repeat-containing protein n=1 Tax=Aquimonas voraii TaxID=265719 RepID=A0A1G6ZWS2_9GAMM|nr:choice-of-anchor D domain-containing protein [Aquimonas voraii]SDE06970.1 FG-GAP repeat-containing protein [Aquimonas voraii]